MGEALVHILLELSVYFKRLRYWLVGLTILLLVVVASLRGFWDWTLAIIVSGLLCLIIVLSHFADVLKPYQRKEPWEK